MTQDQSVYEGRNPSVRLMMPPKSPRKGLPKDARSVKTPTAKWPSIREPLVRVLIVAAAVTCAGLTGCASTYGGMASANNLGAAEYRPAVLTTTPEQEAKYERILAVCRRVAFNRQVTAADEAQLRTITGVTAGATSGFAAGLTYGNLFKQAGYETSLNRDAGLGAAAGLVASLGSAFASGSEYDAEESRRVLLNCLKSQEAAVGYKVME